MNTNIYHIFPSHMTHLSPQLISVFCKQFPQIKQSFIVFGKDCNSAVYEELKVKVKSIYLVSNIAGLTKIISRDSHILLHSLIPVICRYFYFHKYSNISVVCWGSGIKMVSFKNYIMFPLKFLLYHSFKNMITLMEPDQLYLQKRYRIRNTINQPYLGEREVELQKYMEHRNNYTSRDSNNVVFVGNNSTCIKSYIKIAQKKLWKFKDKIDLRFMFHYDYNIQNLEIVELRKICNNNYPNYTFNTEFYNLYDYAKYLDSCNIYICDETRQTGLAAIYTSLKLGKKLYLNGNNYNWVTSLGCKVHHTDELVQSSLLDFLAPDPISIIQNNYNCMDFFECVENKIIGWNNILKLI